MLKSVVNRVALSLAAVMAVIQPASAQLNIGRYGVQPGLEQNYLQYQLAGQSLSQMRGIPGCLTGFGLGCNKTGEVLQQLVEQNNKTSYSNLLNRAAGGEENFRNFSNFYGNNPRLPEVPYSSFWQNDARNIVDGYQYLLGQQFGRTPVENLGLITKNFYWSPLSGDNNSLSLRSGLLDFKYSYGRLLLEEVSKIPNLEQQIQSLGLPKDVTQYYLGNFSRGLEALNAGNENALKDSILHVLSVPFSPEGGEFGRPNAGIPTEFDSLYGQGLEGNAFLGGPVVTLEPEAISLDIPSLSEGYALTPDGSGNRFPTWLIGIPLAGLLLFLLLNGDSGDSSGSRGTLISNAGEIPGVTPPPSPSPTICPTMSGGNGVVNNNQTVNSSCPPPVGAGQEIKKVPEPSVLNAILLLTIVLFLLKNNQRRYSYRVAAR
ncbi:MAG: hypothetical protein ACR2LR_08910 [Hassallia sp.]